MKACVKYDLNSHTHTYENTKSVNNSIVCFSFILLSTHVLFFSNAHTLTLTHKFNAWIIWKSTPKIHTLGINAVKLLNLTITKVITIIKNLIDTKFILCIHLFRVTKLLIQFKKSAFETKSIDFTLSSLLSQWDFWYQK
jgi:hypothetical protein